jgi:DNA-3-methyladenine glycosylase II
MFAIFSLRRPDILPVGTYALVDIVYTSEWFCVSGDLGVQRGLVRWFLSLHSPTHLFALSPEKVSSQGKSTEANLNLAASESHDALLEVVDAAYNSKAVGDVATGARTPISKDEDVDLPSVPPPFTPSIHKTLDRSAIMEPVPLPEGITVAMLKSRLEGKKKIKYVADPFLDMAVLILLVRGAFLTPQEMAALTECWKPFRSLGAFPKDLARMFSCQVRRCLLHVVSSRRRIILRGIRYCSNQY